MGHDSAGTLCLPDGYYWYRSTDDDVKEWPDFEPAGSWRLIQLDGGDVFLAGSDMYYGAYADRGGTFIGPISPPDA